MKKSLIISEQDNIAALLENDRAVEFFVNRGELLLGDIYTASVENILPGIDAAFVNLGKDKMGFLHANDVPGQGQLKERLVPKQKLLVQITKEPTGHKGPRVSTAISLPGRFLVLVPEERGVSISRRISDARERSRLKAVVNLLKPPGVGLIIRTEAKGQGEAELYEDFEQLWDRWQSTVSDAEASIGPTLIYRDQDLLHRVIRDAYSSDIDEVIVDTADGYKRGQVFLSGWSSKQTQLILHSGEEPLLIAKGVDKEIEAALSDRVELPSGGHLNIQPTEALTVIDINSGRFTSSRTQAETVRRTNLEASAEIPRQLRLRNIGGMVIVDFIDMESRKDQQQVLEVFQRHLEEDRAKPQVGQLSDLGLVELTRRRQGQSLRELFTAHCVTCHGLGVIPQLEIFTSEGKRLITVTSNKDELNLRARGQGRRGSRPQPGALRAASASGGRIQPTPLDSQRHSEREEMEEELSHVPREILEQMPDELLDSHVGERNFPKDNFAAEGDEDESETTAHEDRHSQAQPPQRKGSYMRFSEEEEVEKPSRDLDSMVSHAEEVRKELEQSNFAESHSQADSDQADEDKDEPIAEPYSPFEVEPEQFTGVFRLKAKEEYADNGSPSKAEQLELPIGEGESSDESDRTLSANASGNESQDS